MSFTPGAPGPEVPVYVISVAAELTGLHPQTLRAYDRLGLVRPGRSGGGGRRYSWQDVELLREVAELTASGIGLEGVRRILALESRVAVLRRRVAELEDELSLGAQAREQVQGLALRQQQPEEPAPAVRPAAQRGATNLPALRPGPPVAGQAVTIWRRGRP